jgi:hypothetical protein
LGGLKEEEEEEEKRKQRELPWFQTGGALNFITAAPHCGDVSSCGGPAKTAQGCK